MGVVAMAVIRIHWNAILRMSMIGYGISVAAAGGSSSGSRGAGGGGRGGGSTNRWEVTTRSFVSQMIRKS